MAPHRRDTPVVNSRTHEDTPSVHGLEIVPRMCAPCPLQRKQNTREQGKAHSTHHDAGDMALIQRNDVANTGDIVVALIDEEEATLKRFRRRGASIALEPANTAYEVRILPPNRVRIQGKLIGLYRKY